jgi:hypothetical protein
MTTNGGIGLLLIKAVIFFLFQSTITNAEPCNSLTESSTPTLASVCTGGSYTGELKPEAKNSACAGGLGSSCTAEDASLCCHTEGTCCLAGQFLNKTQESCIDCAAGKVALNSNGETTCHSCNVCKQAYSQSKSTECKICGANPGEYWQLTFDGMPIGKGFGSQKGMVPVKICPGLCGTCQKCPTGAVKPAMLSKKKHYLSVKIEPFGLTIENVVNQSKMSCVDVFTQFPQEPCKMCDGKMGYYSNEFGQSECKQCASGKTVNTTTTGNCFMEEHQFLELQILQEEFLWVA